MAQVSASFGKISGLDALFHGLSGVAAIMLRVWNTHSRDGGAVADLERLAETSPHLLEDIGVTEGTAERQKPTFAGRV